MVNFIFLISNFYHSDVNRNLPRRRPIFAARRCPILAARRRPILADKFPPPRRHSRERGNPFLPTNSRIHAVFLWKNEVNSQFCSSKWIPAFAGMTGVFLVFGGNDGVFFAENAGFCSSKLLRLVSPPTNVRGLSVFVVFFCGFGWAGGFFRSNFGGGGIQLIGTLFNRGG